MCQIENHAIYLLICMITGENISEVVEGMENYMLNDKGHMQPMVIYDQTSHNLKMVVS
jgi:hypothetical protein